MRPCTVREPGVSSNLEDGGGVVRVGWGREGRVELISGEGADWGLSVVVYGIVGILQLTFASYLLLITSRTPTGHLFSPSHAVYSIKHVTAIPLVYDRAVIAVNTLASGALRRGASVVRAKSDLGQDDGEGEEDGEEGEEGTAARVTFSDTDEIKLLTPLKAPSQTPTPSTPNSGTSTPNSTSDDSLVNANINSPIAKIVASRLSFWSRLSKRNSGSGVTGDGDGSVRDSTDVDRPSLDELIPTPPSSSSPNPPHPTSTPTVSQTPKPNLTSPSEILSTILNTTAPPPPTAEERKSELEDKIVRETVKEFTKGGMYFAYNFDITRSLQHKQAQVAKSQKQNALLASLNALPDSSSPPTSPNTSPTSPSRKPKPQRSQTIPPSPNAPSSPSPLRGRGGSSEGPDKVDPLAEPYPTLPLWRRVDKQFWWNEWLSKPFVDAGLHSYVLPIMQGHYQISSFPIQREPVLNEIGDSVQADYVVISRRSRDRAGLRYQRRGVDEEANVANFVESESVTRVEREGFVNVFSYVQVRGSIPLFWTQSGYSLKPAPLLSPERTHDQNLDALKRHFERTVPKYGPHSIVNLAEQHGKEAGITNAYRDYVSELADKDVSYTEYDFHMETKGMKYENISKLIDTMQRTFESQGYLWISNNMIMSEQKGVFRVNCIDCLDRTNVVQSAFARHVLNRQLGAVALQNPSETGKTETDVIFNDVWANNGDAISRAYAGTSALKGDFTRTGKRDLGGLLNDGMNSLARMYTSTFSDWFCQAVIDFMLGHRTLSVFSEFLLKLQSTDPRDLIRLSKIRAEAIVTCVSRVLPEGERLLSGWTVFAPEHLNTKIGEKFEEKVLLLTTQALYIISYDYTLDKIKIYTRVPMKDITSITKGAYILSPLEEASRDPVQNAGFMITWLNTNQTTRVSSYSLRNSLDLAVSPPSTHGKLTFTTRTIARASSPFTRRSLDRAPSSSSSSLNGRTLPSGSPRNGPMLSKILSNASPVFGSHTTFAAFKALPVDPTRTGPGADAGYAEPADDLTGASTCKEAVELMVDMIRRACEDIGSPHGNLVAEGDVVNLQEAQRMTSMYAKMEYGVKRLLWLGG
ncbi:hypothetical protein PILCRDRAFT_823187 [Piloderma croceum F 1598]|uniref:SAC domain-containing protein n=1 Tax=Piloderma croceum (strain F 1598) TaxID=765440 RepID=A0A0C3BQT9_PILCF|nr:hypothetical protein PILCRDRAFT_823187 [Piloderma croceum F 1598]